MSVFDVVSDGTEYFLRELEDELKGILHCIAHAGKNDIGYVQEMQKYMRDEYDKFIEDPLNQASFLATGLPGIFILDAYHDFLYGDWNDWGRKTIAEEAENILGDYLEIPPLYLFDEETREEQLREWGRILDLS